MENENRVVHGVTCPTTAKKEVGLDKTQAAMGHTSAGMTERYAHKELELAKEAVRGQKNPFSNMQIDTCAKNTGKYAQVSTVNAPERREKSGVRTSLTPDFGVK